MPRLRLHAYWLPVYLLLTHSAQAGEVDYLRHIKPVLKERCYACHGALKQEAGLRLDSGKLIRRGGDGGEIVSPDAPAKSTLLGRISAADADLRMPPEGAPLKPAEIASIKAWITAGATSPADESPEADPSEHWAFQTPQRPPLPQISNPSWPRNEIDVFLHAQYDQQGLTPVGDTSNAHLLRRLYLDLIGLPPTREQLQSFLADPSDVHYRQIVDELLDSPEYGQRWARHWMDVWRYSDWYGRRQQGDVRNSAPQIWRWRDWIVDSLNADKSYARMVQEMLAADEIAPEDDSAWPATGYLIRNYYSLNPNEWMRHNVEYTAKAFLGLTFNCAHCHDHKYDPIAHDDYFRLRAFFEPIGIRQDRVVGEDDPPPFQPYNFPKSRKVVKAGMVRIYDEHPQAETWFYTGGDERNRLEDRGSIPPGVPDFFKVKLPTIEEVNLPLVASYPAARPGIQRTILEECRSAVSAAEKDLSAKQTELNEARLVAAQAKLASAEASIAADSAKRDGATPETVEELARLAVRAELLADVALAEQNLFNLRAKLLEEESKQPQADDPAKQAEQEKAHAKAIEDLTKQVSAVEKVHVSAMQKAGTPSDSGEYRTLSPTFSSTSTGRRRALALWMTDDAHPLTPRVAINHIWMRHFHVPLVESVYDFGRNGKPPTHPELLDWLAVEFVEHGWSMKHIHRLMVESRAYRLSSAASQQPDNLAIDKDNHFHWHAVTGRMEAEVVRDSTLFIAGKLDCSLGGEVLPNSESNTNFRRSLYFEVFPEEGGSTEMASIFDAPDPVECFRRTTTVVPQQALALSNSELVHACSSAAAERISKTAKDEEAFLHDAFAVVLGWVPNERELTAMRGFLERQKELIADENMRRASLIRVLFNHNDFVTIR